jgi:beta-glucanase (GH16 family)
MTNNIEQCNELIERTSIENYRRYKIVKNLSAIALSASILLSGCQFNPENSVTNTDHPDVDNTEVKTPEPIPEPPKPEIIGVPGLNGELFSSVPTWEQSFYYIESNMSDVRKNWKIFVGPAPANNEAQYYTDNLNNIRIEGGALVIEARVEQMGDQDYTSARISTEGKKDFIYGKFDIYAKLPSGIGTWPAVWLYPSEYKYKTMYANTDFKSTYLDGELDIVEAIGSEPNVVYGIAHALKDPDDGKYFSTIKIPDNFVKFHHYGIEWTPTNLTFTVDGKIYYSVNKKDSYDFQQWPYDQKYNLIINLALGGNWAGRDVKKFPGDGIDKSALPARFEIKSIAYYEYVAPPDSVDK